MYKKMIEEARVAGKANEQAMWAEIDHVAELLGEIKSEHPEMYWEYIRKAHENMYGSHYTPEFAEYDIEQMHSTDASGVRHTGAHWTKQQVLSVWSGKLFPTGTTDCDKWVAANALWHDLHKKFNDEQVLEAAYLFFFADEDYTTNGKVWDYMMKK